MKKFFNKLIACFIIFNYIALGLAAPQVAQAQIVKRAVVIGGTAALINAAALRKQQCAANAGCESPSFKNPFKRNSDADDSNHPNPSNNYLNYFKNNLSNYSNGEEYAPPPSPVPQSLSNLGRSIKGGVFAPMKESPVEMLERDPLWNGLLIAPGKWLVNKFKSNQAEKNLQAQQAFIDAQRVFATPATPTASNFNNARSFEREDRSYFTDTKPQNHQETKNFKQENLYINPSRPPPAENLIYTNPDQSQSPPSNLAPQPLINPNINPELTQQMQQPLVNLPHIVGIDEQIIATPQYEADGAMREGVYKKNAVDLDSIAKNIHDGKQNIHIPTAHNFEQGRSTIHPYINPQELLNGIHNGEYEVVGTNSRGMPVADFKKNIGVDANTASQTRYGTIHTSKLGAHIVPIMQENIRK